MEAASDSESAEEVEAGMEDVQGPKPCTDPGFANVSGSEPRVEAHFGTEYWNCPLEEEILLRWEALEPTAKLHVPPPNPFIATDFSILQQDVDMEEELPLLPEARYASFPAILKRSLPSPNCLSSSFAGQAASAKCLCLDEDFSASFPCCFCFPISL